MACAQEEAEDLIDDKDVEIPDEPNAGAQHAAYRRLNREREEKSAEEIARQVEERYKRMEEGAYGYDDGAALAQTGAVGQQAMQPTVNDPKLWLIQCRPGHERELVTQLLQKYYTMGQQGTPLLIKSAITLDHLKVIALASAATVGPKQRRRSAPCSAVEQRALREAHPRGACCCALNGAAAAAARRATCTWRRRRRRTCATPSRACAPSS